MEAGYSSSQASTSWPSRPSIDTTGRTTGGRAGTRAESQISKSGKRRVFSMPEAAPARTGRSPGGAPAPGQSRLWGGDLLSRRVGAVPESGLWDRARRTSGFGRAAGRPAPRPGEGRTPRPRRPPGSAGGGRGTDRVGDRRRGVVALSGAYAPRPWRPAAGPPRAAGRRPRGAPCARHGVVPRRCPLRGGNNSFRGGPAAGPWRSAPTIGAEGGQRLGRGDQGCRAEPRW